MPLTLADEETKLLKEALMFAEMLHKASQQKKAVFNALEFGKEFDKIVSEPMRSILKWTDDDEKRFRDKYRIICHEAEAGKTPGEQFKKAKVAIGKQFSITAGTVVKGVIVAGITYAAIEGLRSLFGRKKKTGE